MKNAQIMGVMFGSLLLLAACGVNAVRDAPPGVQANEAIAEALAQALVAGDFDAARKDFDSNMESSLGEAKLREAWNRYSGDKGAFLAFGPAYVEYVNSVPCVFVPCEFENGGITVQVTEDEAGTRITGLFLRPPGFSFLQ